MFSDRRDAGNALGRCLRYLRGRPIVVVGLPRGGVPVGHAVAAALDAPLDVLVVRKLGCPWQPEFAIGAIAEGGIRVVNRELAADLGVTAVQIAEVTERESHELARRVRRYRAGRPQVPVSGRHVVVVDDGLATGYTARAAIAALRRRGAARVTVAAPVGAPLGVAVARAGADDVVVLETPPWLFAVSEHYRVFRPTVDDEVVNLLDAAARHLSGPAANAA